VTEQYDHLVLGGTVLAPGMGDAGVVRLPDSRRAVACSTDGNGRWCELDPREGTRRIVAESFRNVACVGARPLATTNCLNFGNPERPEIMWQLAESIAALGEATRELGVPVTGGNVSLYNETRGRAIHPTPVVGILGVLDDAESAIDVAFEDEGDLVLIVGAPVRPGLAGSELQRYLDAPFGGILAPADLELEAAIAEVLHVATREGWLHSAHDVGSGGLLVTLAESAVAGDVGVEVAPSSELSPAQVLCSEAPGRVVVTVPSRHVRAFAQLCGDAGVLLEDVGTVGGDRLVIGDLVDLPLEDVRRALVHGLATLLEG
jgi:phosphoribosylformylglycinamidine synthase subunit PurL